jgi:energy-coupling factor transporter ATP-binding protein EcfA2
MTQDNSTKSIALRKDERGAIVGRTGCGKSRLAFNLIPLSGNVAIIDPKRMFSYPGITIYNSYKEILKRKPSRFIYRPNPDELDNIYCYDEVYRHVYEKGNFFVYTDEILGVLDKNRYPRYLKICYQLGREKGVACLSTFQRPASVPLFLLSESNKFYVFRLTLANDIKRVSQFLPGYSGKLSDKHTFMYYDDNDMEYGIEHKLMLKERS